MLPLLVLATLPLSTSAHEVATGIALAAALASPRRGAFLASSWAVPALAVALVWTLGSLASGDLREGLGHAWLLAPIAALPALATHRHAETVGLAAASVAAAWAIAQALGGAEGHAGFSHHLSLAYALLPPLGVAVANGRWGFAAALLAGVVATRSEGAIVPAAVTIATARLGRGGVWLALGAVATVCLLPLADADELCQRAILWTGGLSFLDTGAVGPGAYAAASDGAYDRLVPGFHFANHAHDSAIQLLAVLGPVGLVATCALAGAGIARGPRGAAAGLAGVLVGALTQDTLGDLEVARACWVWLALSGVATPAGDGEP